MKSDAVKTGMQQAPHRSLFNALGMTEEEMRKPLVGIVSSYNEIVPGHMNLDKIVDAVKLGVGDLPLVLDGRSTPACVIKTVHVETVRFCGLTWDMVKLEGEDENFEQWKSGNIRYWTRDAAKRGYTFTDQTPITFERFEVVEVL